MAAEIVNLLGLGDPYHIGIAVRDIEKAMTRMDELLGIAPWGRIDAEVEAVFRGSQTVSGVRSAFARLGSMYVELVEPTVGDFPAKTFLDERGEGIYHVGYWVDDIGGAIEKAEKVGLSVEWAFPARRPQVVYLDAASTVGMHIEFVHPAMRPGIEDAIARAT
jgi:catechol 2,3-dioxygenase-like lactoylglutathione lyase family enzyme